MKQVRSAARIARQLRKTEAAMDQAILEANALVTAMIEARRAGNLAAEGGDDAIEDGAPGNMARMDARGISEAESMIREPYRAGWELGE